MENFIFCAASGQNKLEYSFSHSVDVSYITRLVIYILPKATLIATVNFNS